MVTFWLNSASVLAQVNFGTSPASILGIFLAVAGAGLYFLRSVRPELARDQDIFFAAVGVVCGFILVFQGWRLDPILQFSQLLLAGTTVYFGFESVRLRGIATDQAKRSTPIVDRERPVSDRYSYERRSPYEAEVEDDLEPLPYDDYYEEERPRARIPGSREGRSSRNDYYEEEAPKEIERERRRSNDRPETNDRPRRRDRPRPKSRNVERLEGNDWDGNNYSTTVDDWDKSTKSERRRPRSNSNVPTRPETGEREAPPRRRRRRPPSSDYSSPPLVDDDVMPVDYKPIDQLDEKPDNSANVDDF